MLNFFVGQALILKIEPHPTLCDGKVLGHVYNIHCSRCLVCYSRPTFLNDYERWLQHPECDINPIIFTHGLRPLHTLMGAVENLLNLSSTLFLEGSKSQARGQDKLEKIKKFQALQKKLEEEFNLRVGYPKPEGGTTTVGNVARALFDQPEKFASVLSIDYELVKILSLLLSAIRSFHKVNLDEYQRLSNRAMEIFKTKYPKFRPSPKVHLLLVHGVQILSQMELAPGFYSEEGPEANNKHLRKDKIEHARHDSRIHNMEDVYHMSLARSDPKVAKIGLARRQKLKKEKPISAELRRLLIIEETQEYAPE
jgi:hypothetical protein